MYYLQLHQVSSKLKYRNLKKLLSHFFVILVHTFLLTYSLLHELAQRRSTYLVSKRNRGGILFLGPQFYQEKIRF